MERKIGEIFEYNGEWYQCVEGTNCRECDFSSNNVTCDIHGAFKCTCKGRSDETSVVFKKLEKVGEPFIGKVHIQLQRYKIYTEPIIDPAEKFGYVNEKNTIAIEIKETKENMEEKKVNLKPFSLEAAKSGKPVYTRDGRKVRIICFDRIFYHEGYDYPIVAMVNNKGNESVHAYTKDGLLTGGEECDYDLMMLSEKKEGWVNVYNADTTFYYVDGRVFETKDEAVQEAKEEVEKEQREKNEYIDTIKVKWEE